MKSRSIIRSIVLILLLWISVPQQVMAQSEQCMYWTYLYNDYEDQYNRFMGYYWIYGGSWYEIAMEFFYLMGQAGNNMDIHCNGEGYPPE